MALVRGGIVVKPHVQAFCDALEAELGPHSFGTYAGHSPPEGPTQAVDIFNLDTPAGWADQDAVCEFAWANAHRYGLRYSIRREHIRNVERAGEGWRRQTHKGNRRLDHYDHSHHTFYAQASGVLVPPAPRPLPAITKGQTMFLYSTAPKVDQGSIWLVVEGTAYRQHLPSDVQRMIDKGVVNFGEMSEAFHNLFQHHG